MIRLPNTRNPLRSRLRQSFRFFCNCQASARVLRNATPPTRNVTIPRLLLGMSAASEIKKASSSAVNALAEVACLSIGAPTFTVSWGAMETATKSRPTSAAPAEALVEKNVMNAWGTIAGLSFFHRLAVETAPMGSQRLPRNPPARVRTSADQPPIPPTNRRATGAARLQAGALLVPPASVPGNAALDKASGRRYTLLSIPSLLRTVDCALHLCNESVPCDAASLLNWPRHSPHLLELPGDAAG